MKSQSLDFRWGPIPVGLLWVNQWRSIFRPHPTYYPAPWPETVLLFRGPLVLFLTDSQELESRGYQVFRRFFLSPRKSQAAYLTWKKIVTQLRSYPRELSSAPMHQWPDSELRLAWNKIHHLTDAFWRIGILPELAAYGAAPVLTQELSRCNLRHVQMQKARATLSAPEQLSFYQEEERALLSIYRLPSKERHEQLRKHAKEFHWIRNSYAGAGQTSLSYFSQRFRAHRSDWRHALRTLESHTENIRRQRTRTLRALGKAPTITTLAEGLRFAIAWQDERKGEIFRYLSSVDRLAREIARRNRFPLSLLKNALSEEVEVKLSQSLRRQLQSRTRERFGVLMNGQGCRIIHGKEAKELDQRYWRLSPAHSMRQLQGIVAHGGASKVVGTAFLIRTHADLARFPRGAILVASMTAPEYVVAMRRARAVITDEGGITSHAAIVSRELGLPCIVGTKYATQILKTGDRVSVDSKNGYVKKLG